MLAMSGVAFFLALDLPDVWAGDVASTGHHRPRRVAAIWQDAEGGATSSTVDFDWRDGGRVGDVVAVVHLPQQ